MDYKMMFLLFISFYLGIGLSFLFMFCKKYKINRQEFQDRIEIVIFVLLAVGGWPMFLYRLKKDNDEL